MSPANLRYIKWSYSKYKVFTTCKEKYFRQYIAYEKTNENKIAALDGTVLQALFEQWVNYGFWKSRGKAWLTESLPNFYHYYFHQEGTRYELNKDDTHEKHLKTLHKMTETFHDFLGPMLYSGARISAEVEISADLGPNEAVHGHIDFIVHSELSTMTPKVTIIDLKAMTEKSSWMEDIQLVFYNLLFMEKHGYMPSSSGFFTAKDGKFLEKKITLDDVVALRNELRKATQEARKTDIRKIASDLKTCYGCSFKEGCWKSNGLVPWDDVLKF